MNRTQKTLKHIKKSGFGLEIGPSHNPIAPKSDGYRVHIIDHMTQTELIDKYREHKVNLKKIESVDFVWDGEKDYSELTGNRNFYDWIIASHVIEHTPCLISFLNDCDQLLNESGVLSLVIPDKRYCFDHFRPMTGIAKVIDSLSQGHKVHTPGTVAEYFLNVVAKNNAIAWHPATEGNYNFVHSLADARGGMESVKQNGNYIDVHAWCFTPHSFRLMVEDLFSLGFIQLRELDFFPTVGCEFFITLSRQGQGSQMSRLELLEKVEMDQLE